MVGHADLWGPRLALPTGRLGRHPARGAPTAATATTTTGSSPSTSNTAFFLSYDKMMFHCFLFLLECPLQPLLWLFLSSDPISNVMPTPTFGPIQLYENIPRNDTQDFRVVCDKMNLRTRREVALAFEHLLRGLAGVPPKVSAEQEGFMEPIDVRRL